MDKEEIMNASDINVKKSIGVLLDPDKAYGKSLDNVLRVADECRADYILAGGSLTSHNIDELITEVKRRCTIPVILFPGNLLQLSLKADIIFFLSLISGRNPEYLIGNHVVAAPYLRSCMEKILPVGYILVSCGNKTSVEYISQTEAIPSDKADIVVATALAGEMLGLRLIYLEAGSGASNHVPLEIIKGVKNSVSIPVAAGGGIKKAREVENIFAAGANLIILGNGVEKDPVLLREACIIRDGLT